LKKFVFYIEENPLAYTLGTYNAGVVVINSEVVGLAPELGVFTAQEHGCKMVCFQSKNPNFGKF
jgi:hypothetical protein